MINGSNETGIRDGETLETREFRRAELQPDISIPESIILRLIRRGALSKVDLIEKTDFSRSKVSAYIDSLIEKDYLLGYGVGDYTGGRRSVLFGLNGEKGLVLGVDIGATSIDLIITNFSGKSIARYSEPAQVSSGPEIILDRVCDMFEKLIESNSLASKKVIAMGIGVPGPVNSREGIVVSPPIMPGWDQFPIIPYIQKRFNETIVVVDNDVNIMALGELANGVGVGAKNMIFVKIGTGIGAGIIVDGKVYRGTDGCAGDIGHICVDKSGPICPCGNTGCLEALAGGAAIAERAVREVKEGNSEILQKYYEQRNGMLKAEDVARAAKEGDTTSIEIIRDSGRLIGDVLAGLVNFANPELIVIGGGVSKMGNLLLSSIRRSILKRSLPLATKNLSIVFSSIMEDAGVFGAINSALDIALAPCEK